MSEIETFFETLLFGSGLYYLGLLLVLSICVGLLQWKYGGVIVMPVLILLGMEYLAKSLPYPAIICFFVSVFALLYMVKQLK